MATSSTSSALDLSVVQKLIAERLNASVVRRDQAIVDRVADKLRLANEVGAEWFDIDTSIIPNELRHELEKCFVIDNTTLHLKRGFRVEPQPSSPKPVHATAPAASAVEPVKALIPSTKPVSFLTDHPNRPDEDDDIDDKKPMQPPPPKRTKKAMDTPEMLDIQEEIERGTTLMDDITEALESATEKQRPLLEQKLKDLQEQQRTRRKKLFKLAEK
jgi:hypothetical protein